MISFAIIWKTILATIGAILGVFFYGNRQGHNSEKSKSDAMLLDDIITAKKIDNDVNNLDSDSVNIRLFKFSRKNKK